MPSLCVFGEPAVAAEALAKQLSLPFVSADAAAGYALQLWLRDGTLGLCRDGAAERNPVVVDWTSPNVARRLSEVSRRTEPLSRALGLKANHRPTVVDATAGLGGDSVIICALGCPVLALERNPVVAALFADGIERAADKQIELRNQDAAEWMATQADNSQEIIFLDPMFGKDDTRAQVKKPMQLMQQLLADDAEEPDLLTPALRIASKRVVVKRAAKAPPLNNAKPSLRISGKAIRFDIYLSA